MANGYQMEYLIQEASEKVAELGRKAELTDLMLCGIGYLAHEVQKPQWWSIKRVVPIAFAFGTSVGAGMLWSFLKFMEGK